MGRRVSLKETREAAQAAQQRRSLQAWWIGLAVAATLVAIGLAMLIAQRRESAPAPPSTPQQVVASFWEAMIAKRYSEAVALWPDLVTTYGSRAQAGERLRGLGEQIQPARLQEIGQAYRRAGSDEMYVPYSLLLASGRVRSSTLLVKRTADGHWVLAGGLS